MIVLPHRVEFGIKIRFYVPAFHALKDDGQKVAYIEQGEEALYPSATQHIILPRRNDDDRYGRADTLMDMIRSAHGRNRIVELTRGAWPEARFIPEPFVPNSRYPEGDVVICPRARAYGSSKNWPHWPELAQSLGGLKVVAAGAPDSSTDLTSWCECAWEFPRFLDASIHAIRKARLVIATDAGLAHLAVLCGTPLLMITHNGLVAPGPVSDEKGRIIRPVYWPVRMDRYYHAANHIGSPIHTIDDAWDHPQKVARRVEELLLT